MKKVFIAVVLGLLSGLTFAQNPIAQDEPEDGIKILTLVLMIEGGYLDASERIEELNAKEIYLDDYINSHPKSCEAYNLRGQVKKVKGEYVSAIQDLRKAVSLGTKYLGSAYEDIAECKSKLNDFYGAKESYTIALQYSEADMPKMKARINAGLAYVLFKLKDFSQALNNANLAVTLDPEYAYFVFLRGLINLQLAEKEKGCLDLSKAGEMGYSKSYEVMKEVCK